MAPKTFKGNEEKTRTPEERKPTVRKIKLLKHPSEESESTDVMSSTDDEERWKENSRTAELPADYWNIQKLIKYIKAGNQTATIVSLCCIKDFDLKDQFNQLAIMDIGGLEVLVNLLECNNTKCRLGSLSVLAEICDNIDARKTVVDLGAIPLIMDIFSSPMREIKTLASETLAHLARVRLARKMVRNLGGIPKLVDILDINNNILRTPRNELSLKEREILDMTRAAAKALFSLSESRHNKEHMRKSGIIFLMAKILKSIHVDVVTPIMGTLQQCASEGVFKLAICTEGMIPCIAQHLTSSDVNLKLQCSLAYFKCATDSGARDLIRKNNGIDPLVAIIKDSNNRANKKLMAAATGAIWKVALTEKNVKKLDQLRAIGTLVQLLTDDNDEVLTNTTGALAECVKFQSNREVLRNAGGIAPLVNHLNGSHPPLLQNVSDVLRECAKDPESLNIMEELDAIRLIWSLLNNVDQGVKAHAAWALCPCIENASNSGDLVRSLVGGLDLVVDLLKSNDREVIASICAAISTIAKDEDNMEILADHKVVYLLAGLVNTKDDLLRENISAAIASCAAYEKYAQKFGELQTIPSIVGYMVSTNIGVHRTTAMALQKLSVCPDNCIDMHRSGVVPFLLETMASTDKTLQLASGGCLQNIRKLALRSEEYLLKRELCTKHCPPIC